MLKLVIVIASASALFSSAAATSAPWVTFTNTSTALVLSTPAYELALSSASGTLLHLLDTPSSQTLFYGSAFGQLWALVGPSGSLANSDSALTFAWSWLPSQAILALTWHSAASGASVAVNVSAPAQQRYLDLTFALLAAPASPGVAYTSLWFPSNALFNSTGSTVFYPQLPGILLNASFFAANNAANVPYPGSGTFAEFLHLQAATSANATASVFTVSGPALTIPHFKGLFPSPGSGQGLWRYAHDISPINVTTNCSVGSSSSSSSVQGADSPPPCALGAAGTVTVRLAVGGSVLADLALYRDANALDLPPITEKLPAPLLARLARAPLYKVDALELGLPFEQYSAQLLPLLPRPGLVHYCAFEPVAFDHWYPDYLPPAPRFGSTCDALAAWQAAQAAGHLVMPYTNPTWWDPAAPTLTTELAAAGLTLQDVTVLNSTLQPTWETYPDVPPASGVVMDLGHPFVRARWQRLVCQLQGSSSSSASACPAPTSCNDTGLGSDLLFEDQLGARNAKADRRGGLGALGNQAAIESHAAAFAPSLLATEQGYDRLAPHVWGFFGNAIEELGHSGYPWGGGNWTPYPAAAQLLGHSVLLHVHNLATTAFAADLPSTCWALATGARLSIDGAALLRAPPQQRAFAAAVATLQAAVVSQWTGYSLSEYADLAPGGLPALVGQGATRSTFTAPPALAARPLFPSASGSYAVTASWENEGGGLPVSAGAVTALLPPRGCWAAGSALDVLGGFFVGYNGRALPGPGAHAIVEDRACGAGCLRLWHPVGADTLLDVLALPGCSSGGGGGGGGGGGWPGRGGGGGGCRAGVSALPAGQWQWQRHPWRTVCHPGCQCTAPGGGSGVLPHHLPVKAANRRDMQHLYLSLILSAAGYSFPPPPLLLASTSTAPPPLLPAVPSSAAPAAAAASVAAATSPSVLSSLTSRLSTPMARALFVLTSSNCREKDSSTLLWVAARRASRASWLRSPGAPASRLS